MSQYGDGSRALLFFERADVTDTRASSIFFSSKAFPAIQTLEVPVFGVTQYISDLCEKVRLVVVLLIFFEVAQEVVNHRMCHVGCQTGPRSIWCNTFCHVYCCRRECNTKLVIPVYGLHEVVVFIAMWDLASCRNPSCFRVTGRFTVGRVRCWDKIYRNPIVTWTRNPTIFQINSYVIVTMLGLVIGPQNHLPKMADDGATTPDGVFSKHIGHGRRAVKIVHIDNNIGYGIGTMIASTFSSSDTDPYLLAIGWSATSSFFPCTRS
jgi:hypothetical protein